MSETRRIDLTDGRTRAEVEASLRADIATARAVVDAMSGPESDRDVLDTLDWQSGFNLAWDGQSDGIEWPQPDPRWECSDGAVTMDLTAPFQAHRTTARVDAFNDDEGRWVGEGWEGITVTEGDAEVVEW